jgi:hypothetical protein
MARNGGGDLVVRNSSVVNLIDAKFLRLALAERLGMLDGSDPTPNRRLFGTNNDTFNSTNASGSGPTDSSLPFLRLQRVRTAEGTPEEVIRAAFNGSEEVRARVMGSKFVRAHTFDIHFGAFLRTDRTQLPSVSLTVDVSSVSIPKPMLEVDDRGRMFRNRATVQELEDATLESLASRAIENMHNSIIDQALAAMEIDVFWASRRGCSSTLAAAIIAGQDNPYGEADPSPSPEAGQPTTP